MIVAGIDRPGYMGLACALTLGLDGFSGTKTEPLTVLKEKFRKRDSTRRNGDGMEDF
jgi:hypothetical protein